MSDDLSGDMLAPSWPNLVYLGFYVAFNTVQVISQRVFGRADETSTYSWSRFCTVNCRPTASNYQLSHLRSSREPNPELRDGRRECYHSATLAPRFLYRSNIYYYIANKKHCLNIFLLSTKNIFWAFYNSIYIKLIPQKV